MHRMLAPYFIRICRIFFGAMLLCMPVAAQALSVRISNLTDITVPLWVVGDPDIVQDVFVCIYSKEANAPLTSTYSITAIGDGPGFFMKSGPNLLSYTVTWNDGGAGNPSGGTTAPMVNNVKLLDRKRPRSFSDIPIGSTDCNAGSSPTARLRIIVSKAKLDAARDGTFTGVLSLLLSPS